MCDDKKDIIEEFNLGDKDLLNNEYQKTNNKNFIINDSDLKERRSCYTKYNNNFKCLVCNQEFEIRINLTNHFKKHKLTVKEYYDQYLKEDKICICGCKKETKFNFASGRYNDYIVYHHSKNKILSDETKEILRKKITGTIQSKETIEKRAIKLRGKKRPLNAILITASKNRGRKRTSEQNHRNSEAQKGRKNQMKKN